MRVRGCRLPAIYIILFAACPRLAASLQITNTILWLRTDCCALPVNVQWLELRLTILHHADITVTMVRTFVTLFDPILASLTYGLPRALAHVYPSHPLTPSLLGFF